MPLNPTLLKPAVIGAGDIALNSSVDSKLANYNPASVINANVTTIDGGKITTGSITTNHIATAGLSAGIIKAGVMYNTGGNAASYTMKIDLDAGEIIIK